MKALPTAAAAAAVLLAACAWASHASTPGNAAQRPQPGSQRLIPYEQLVALTFDDGPTEHTASLLQLLDSLNVTATFMFLGRNAEQHPGLVRAVRDHGHELGSHTYSHPHLGTLSPEAGEAEIAHALEIVEAAAGARPTVFRAPYGDEPPYLSDLCRKLGITLIPLGVAGYDWEDRSPEQIAGEIVRKTGAGSFVLLHDGSDVPGADRSRTVAAVRLIVPALRAKGYRFVTASALAAARDTSSDARRGVPRPPE